MLKSFKRGFTLAEVLITLAIIGVVAAMVVPALLGSTNQTEFKTALKKSVATLNQALTMAIALDGNDTQTAVNAGTTANRKDQLSTMFKQRLNILSTDSTDAFYTADGMYFEMDASTNSLACGNGPTSTVASNNACYAMVDVNGTAGPNMLSTTGGGVFRDRYYLIIDQRNVRAGNDTQAMNAMVGN